MNKPQNPTLTWPVALLLGWALMSGPATATTYRWTDDAGNIVYSQTPPTDGRASEVVKGPPPPGEPPATAQQKLQQRLDLLEGQRKARAEDRQQGEQTKQQAEAKARDCETARNNLQALRQSTRRLYRTEQGSFSRLTEEQRNARIQETEAFIQENCQ